ncbi:hypothetical protein OJAV_G00132550 [Oryzias javanicus]|uniref:SEA domain-containing protein n=1 Tax=Oryzias javanicus TaxID=123683 RepID=A0A3S2MRG2_ORYJA|nr:hypothetical protein OJAV_G00132550 [Oryzias javanicus]
MSFELKVFQPSVNTSNNDARMTADPGGVAGEGTGLLASQPNNCNGEVDSEQGQGNGGGALAPPKNKSAFNKLDKKVRIGMAVVLIVILIPIVVVISVAICAATYKDKDDIYDSSLFTVPQYFNGSFQMSSVPFKEGEDIGLQQKLADLYKSSPALGRYFSEAKIYPFRNASNVVDYQLTFVLPEDRLEELRNFTLSNEMVQSVFRQFLYDQDQDSASTYIIPVSLIMSSRH